jgi:hypothetical protein
MNALLRDEYSFSEWRSVHETWSKGQTMQRRRTHKTLPKEECAEGMEQRSNYAMLECTNQTNLRKEFCVQEVLMERRSDYKAVKDAYKIKHGKEYAYAA